MRVGSGGETPDNEAEAIGTPVLDEATVCNFCHLLEQDKRADARDGERALAAKTIKSFCTPAHVLSSSMLLHVDDRSLSSQVFSGCVT